MTAVAPTQVSNPSLKSDDGWKARLELGFVAEPNNPVEHCRLAHRKHFGPLVVQKSFYPEGPACPHVYLVHPPGGMVGGDKLEVNVQLGASARALITTPAAGKVYRSLTDTHESQLTQHLHLDAGATLEWFPQETLVFDGAVTRLKTAVHLEGDARFAGWEIIGLGRPASNEKYTRGTCRQTLEVQRDGLPLMVERNLFKGGSNTLQAMHGLRDAPIAGTMVMTPIADGDALDALVAEFSVANEEALTAITRVQDALIARYLGDSPERARAFFATIWQRLRPKWCGRDAVAPRIWDT